MRSRPSSRYGSFHYGGFAFPLGTLWTSPPCRSKPGRDLTAGESDLSLQRITYTPQAVSHGPEYSRGATAWIERGIGRLWIRWRSRCSAREPIPPCRSFLRDLTESRLIDSRELKQVLDDHAGFDDESTPQLADTLRTRGLLNEYQLKRLLAGQTFGLVLGNYRVLERLGSGGMGVVYKAEHVHMRRPVALKVLLTEDDDNTVFMQRFNSEMQALAVLHHPNIVLAFDAGEIAGAGRAGQTAPLSRHGVRTRPDPRTVRAKSTARCRFRWPAT